MRPLSRFRELVGRWNRLQLLVVCTTLVGVIGLCALERRNLSETIDYLDESPPLECENLVGEELRLCAAAQLAHTIHHSADLERANELATYQSLIGWAMILVAALILWIVWIWASADASRRRGEPT
jgi:hypothetical protein